MHIPQCPLSSRSRTHSICAGGFPSASVRSSFSVPSLSWRWTATSDDQMPYSAARCSRNARGRSVIASQSCARFPKSHLRTCPARYGGWPWSTSRREAVRAFHPEYDAYVYSTVGPSCRKGLNSAAFLHIVTFPKQVAAIVPLGTRHLLPIDTGEGISHNRRQHPTTRATNMSNYPPPGMPQTAYPQPGYPPPPQPSGCGCGGCLGKFFIVVGVLFFLIIAVCCGGSYCSCAVKNATTYQQAEVQTIGDEIAAHANPARSSPLPAAGIRFHLPTNRWAKAQFTARRTRRRF